MAFTHKKHRFRGYRPEEVDTETLDELIEYFDTMIVRTMDFDEHWTKRAKWARFLKANPELLEVVATAIVPKRRYWWSKG